jgi:hypothetical protein
MNARIPILVSVSAVALLTVVGLTVRATSNHDGAASRSTDFAARFQPILEGIGSTRELTPVPLNEGRPASPPQPSGSTAKAKRHERAAVRP